MCNEKGGPARCVCVCVCLCVDSGHGACARLGEQLHAAGGCPSPTCLLAHGLHQRAQLDHVLQEGLEGGVPQLLHGLRAVGSNAVARLVSHQMSAMQEGLQHGAPQLLHGLQREVCIRWLVTGPWQHWSDALWDSQSLLGARPSHAPTTKPMERLTERPTAQPRFEVAGHRTVDGGDPPQQRNCVDQAHFC